MAEDLNHKLYLYQVNNGRRLIYLNTSLSRWNPWLIRTWASMKEIKLKAINAFCIKEWTWSMPIIIINNLTADLAIVQILTALNKQISLFS